MAQTKIAGLFLDPTVVSGLTAITSGASDADYLFVWDATDSLLKKVLPDHLGLAAAAHTIESHTATGATGAELETLTGGTSTDADSLHTHNAKAPLAGPTFTGTTTFATLSDGTIGVTAWVDQDDMSSNSATLIPTQQSVKAYSDTKAPIASPTFTTGATSPSFITGNSGTIKLMDGNGSNFASIAAHATTTADIAYTWPPAGPSTNGYALTSTTAGVMSWAEAGGASLSGSTNNTVVTVTGANAMIGKGARGEVRIWSW